MESFHLSDNSIFQDSDNNILQQIDMADDTKLDTQTWNGPPLKKFKHNKVKIVPHNILKNYNKYLQVSSGKLFVQITLLCVKSPWRERLINGLKKYEFRSKNNKKHVNDLVYIVENKKAYGTVVFGNSNKIWISKYTSNTYLLKQNISAETIKFLQTQYCVYGDKQIYSWPVTQYEQFEEPMSCNYVVTGAWVWKTAYLHLIDNMIYDVNYLPYLKHPTHVLYLNSLQSKYNKQYKFKLLSHLKSKIGQNIHICSVLDCIYQHSTAAYEFIWMCSYIVECFTRQQSIKHWCKNILSSNNSQQIYEMCKKAVFHKGFRYILQNHLIETWDVMVGKCVKNYETYLHLLQTQQDKVTYSTIFNGDKCIICCGVYACKIVSNPYLSCNKCKGCAHLSCIYNLNDYYYCPVLGKIPDKNSCKRTLHWYEKNKYYVPGSKKWTCMLCLAIQKYEQQTTEHILRLQYIVCQQTMYYFWNLQSLTFEKYQQTYVHSYFRIVQLCWWQKIDFNYVCYDNWNAASYNAEIYHKSQNIWIQLWTEFINLQIKQQKLNDKWIKLFVRKYFQIENPIKLQTDQWRTYYRRNEWKPINCQPFYWKTNQIIGSIISNHLLLPAEFKLYQYIIAHKICTSVQYNADGDISCVVPVSDDTKSDNWKIKFKTNPQQWDFSAPGRVKNYFGSAHYCHPVLGNKCIARHKAVTKKYNDILQPGGRNSDTWGNVITKMDQSQQNFPKLLILLNEFISCRYRAIHHHFQTTDNMQLNGYKFKRGFIHNHFDLFNHYLLALLSKVVNDSGVHLQMKSFTKVIYNPTMFHPLYQGMFLELTKWTRTWFKHCKLPWMNSSDTIGSITAIFRKINHKEAIFYPFPLKVNRNPKPIESSQIVYEKYIQLISKQKS